MGAPKCIGPDPAEQNLLALWDAIDSTRRTHGRQVAAAIAEAALHAAKDRLHAFAQDARPPSKRDYH